MNIRRFLIFFIGAFACLYLAYSSAVTVPYIRHDSIRYFHKFYNRDMDSSTNPQYEWLKALGRPIAAEEEKFLYRNINHLSDLSSLRFITIIVFALGAALLASIVVPMGMQELPAFCISTAIFTLPGVQECVFVPFLFIGLSILLSLLAYAIWSSRMDKRIRFILSFILLEISFFTYVPSAFFFLMPISFIIILSVDDWQSIWKYWLRDLLFGLLIGALYLFFMKTFYYKNLESSGHPITWQNVLLFIQTFLPQGVPQTFNLWNIYYSKGLGILIGFIILGFLLFNVYGQDKARGWQRLLAIMTNFLLFNMVWFMLGGYLPRTFIASQALAVVMVYWCGELLRKTLKIENRIAQVSWPIILLITGLLFANATTIHNVWNSNAEFMFIRSRLAQGADSNTREIHLIRPQDQTKGYNGLNVSYDNFNTESTSDYEVPDLIRVALKDMDDPPFEMHCIVTSSNYGDPIPNIGPYTLIIDMNDLVRISRVHLK